MIIVSHLALALLQILLGHHRATGVYTIRPSLQVGPNERNVRTLWSEKSYNSSMAIALCANPHGTAFVSYCSSSRSWKVNAPTNMHPVLTANVLRLDGQLPLEILTIYEASLSQISALASLTALAPSVSLHDNSPGMHAYTSDALVKARIFWYAYINEGITTALRGGRLMLYVSLFSIDLRILNVHSLSDEVDLETFQRTLPQEGQTPPHSSAVQRSHQVAAQLFVVPLRLSNICRRVHDLLTGRDARQRAERRCPIDSDAMQQIWEGLDSCWNDFSAFRRTAIGIAPEEVERYIASWQIFIFECRESVESFTHAHSPIVTQTTSFAMPSSSTSSRNRRQVAVLITDSLATSLRHRHQRHLCIACIHSLYAGA